MKGKHFVLTLVVVACTAAAYFWVTDSWPGQNAGVKNPEAGQPNQNARATAPTPTAQSAAKLPAPAATPAAETAAPDQTPVARPDDGLPLFKERESLRVKLEELEKKVKDIPTQRDKAKKEPNDGPETQKFKQLMATSAEDSQKLKDEFAEFDKKFAGLPQFKENAPPKNSPTLTGENVTLASTISENVKLWAVPLLALLSVLVIITLVQLLLLRSRTKKLAASNHELILNIQQLNKSGTEAQVILLREMKAATGEQLLPLGDQVERTKEVAAGLRDSLNQVLEHLARLPADDKEKPKPDHDPYAGQRNDQSRETAKPHSFPIAVADYLNSVKGMSLHLKADQFNDVLVETTEDEGEFVLVKDPPAERVGISYVVPMADYFGTKQDFLNGYYPKYYECSSQPPIGTVQIRRPAKVERAEGGWRLAGERGILEVLQ
jgi:hypothetical protein